MIQLLPSVAVLLGFPFKAPAFGPAAGACLQLLALQCEAVYVRAREQLETFGSHLSCGSVKIDAAQSGPL